MTQSLLKEKEQHGVPASDTALAPMGIGPTLRSLREARRISLGEASQRLKFSARQIEALESEDWGRLPSGVPLRGFVRNYARYMEADVESVLILLDNQVGSTAPRSVMSAPGVPPSVGADAEIPTSTEASHRPWGWLLIILAILIIAGFYAIDRGWVPESWLIFEWLQNIASNE